MTRRFRAAFVSLLVLGPMLGSAAADIAMPLVRANEGGIEVRIGVTPAPLRVGASEWNVWAREIASGRFVAAADLELELRRVEPEASAMSELSEMSEASMATHHHQEIAITATLEPDEASAGSFQKAHLELRHPGRWIGRLRVSTGVTAETISFEFELRPAHSVLLRHWLAFAIVPLGLLSFGLHQWRVYGPFGRA